MLEKILRLQGASAIIVAVLIVCSIQSSAQSISSSGGMPSIEAKTAAMRHMPGFMPLHWDVKSARLYLEIPQLNADMLYFDSLPYGTGSNDLGLDRGQVSPARLVRFERIGPKVLLVQPNESFRSSARDPAERLAVRQSFPESILASFSVVAENAGGTDSGPVVGGCHRFFCARFARRVRGVAETGRLQARRGTIRDCHRSNQSISEEYRG
jgi:hypothetical protein